jgi:hypothetical protein
VNGSKKSLIRPSEIFKRTQQKLLRDRYRKNKTGGDNFVKLIKEIIQELMDHPRLREFVPTTGGVVRAHLEPFPKGSSREGYELWKLELNMPQLQGGAEKGRLIYLLNVTRKEVTLLWIYTHAEHKKRPPDRELKRFLLEVIETDLESTNAVESEEEETGTEEDNPEDSSRD